MKKNINHLILGIFLLSVFNVQAQSIPTLTEIVQNVKANTLPFQRYNVNITQTINAPERSNTAKSITSGTLLNQTMFNIAYSPGAGFFIDKKATTEYKTVQNKPNISSNSQPTDIKVTVNLPLLYKTVNEWSDINITYDKLEDSNAYLITAKYKLFGLRIWVNTEYHYISRIILSIDGTEFSTTDFRYRYVNNKYWLPSEINITQATSGTQISQTFDKYNFHQ